MMTLIVIFNIVIVIVIGYNLHPPTHSTLKSPPSLLPPVAKYSQDWFLQLLIQNQNHKPFVGAEDTMT
jgi:hypothetical protein